MMVNYSQELINEIKELFPKEETIIKLAETGNPHLGGYLDGYMQACLGCDEILVSISLKELQEKAFFVKRRSVMYNKWYSEYTKIKNSIPLDTV